MVLGFSLGRRGFSRGFSLLAAGMAMLLVLDTGAASARTERTGSAFKRDLRADKREKAVRPPVTGPVVAVVSLARQRIHIYSSDGLIAQSAISSGQAGYRTPTGMFSVIQKNRWHRSNIYSGAPMPYMQRITWSGIALHAGVIPGYPASHGCIRLPNQFAVELFAMTRMGARVIVAPEDTEAVDFASPHLPVPLMATAQETAASTKESEKTALVSVALGPTGERTDAATSVPRLLNPQERAKLARAQTAADATAKAKTAKAATELSADRAERANEAISALRTAGLAVEDARRRIELATKAVENAKSPQIAERAKAAVAAAEQRLADMIKAEEAARALEAEVTPAAIEAARAAFDAETANATAQEAAKVAVRGTEPISIFISRKTGKLYIRQNWVPVHETPVTITDPELQIGTHNYVAMAPTADGRNLRWLSVTFPTERASARHDDDDDDDDRPRSRRAKPAVVAPKGPVETAMGALSRIEIPEETKQFIADRLWTGASLIVSDQGISNETGTYTDFIILAR